MVVAAPYEAPFASRSVRALLAALALVTAAACRAPATQIELALATDAPVGRRIEIRTVSVRGIVEPSQLAARAAEGLFEASITREILAQPTEIGSVGVLPVERGSASPVTVWIRAKLLATPREPEVSIDRVAQLRFVPRRPQFARVFLTFRCADRAGGCSSVSPENCTVSVRCREQGTTCGDEGGCVSPELLTRDIDASLDAMDASRDASAPPPDAELDAEHDAELDTGGEGGVDVSSDAALDLPPPRQLSPLSTSTVNAVQPTLRFAPSVGADDTRIQVCRDRALSVGCASGRVERNSWRPATDLAPGWWFWSARPVVGSAVAGRASPVWQFRVPRRDRGRDTSSWSASDFDGDGRGDAVVSAVVPASSSVFLYDFSTIEPTVRTLLASAAASEQGHAISPAGDIDGDGYGDLLVGARLESERGLERGRVRVFFGGARGLDAARSVSIDGDADGDRFGAAVDAVGDLDRDGYGDFVVGATHARPGGMVEAGAAYVYFGAENRSFSRRVTLSGRAPFERFGSAVTGVADCNDDGLADVLVTAVSASWMGASDAGRLAVYFGTGTGIATSPSFEIGGAAASDQLGLRVGAGDVNGDGLGDWIVGSWSATRAGRSLTGEARLYLGAATPTLAQTVEGANAGDQLGMSVEIVGDCDADGYDEVVVGANTALSGADRTGAITLFRGGPTGIDSLVSATLRGRAPGDQLGWEIGAPGDVDGDGLDDVLVGAPRASGGAGALLDVGPVLHQLGRVTTPRPRWIESSGAQGLGFCIAQRDPALDVQRHPRARPSA